MTVRVIGGEYGGRVLKTVRGAGTRPLLSQVRESLFDILGDRVVDALVWDLFAGTGATGIEALSRGAKRVIFIEKSNRALGVLRDNLGMLGESCMARSDVQRGDAWDPRAIPEGVDLSRAPDVVFLDPPYAMVAEDQTRSAYRARQIAGSMKKGGVLCFHFMEGLLQEDDFDSELNVEIRHWGTSGIAFLELATGTADGEPPASRSCSASR